MSVFPGWLPGVLFVDRLLRFGVATLFGLDVALDVHTQWNRWNGYVPPGYRAWLEVGASPTVAAGLGWMRVCLAGLGALLVLPYRTARVGVLLLVVALACDLSLAWRTTWWPPYRMQFVLGTALLLISQVLVRTHVRRAELAWERLERGLRRRADP